MKENPLVSILIPLYNSEKYIAETIESCLRQTYKAIEIILVDDGSTDDSLKIARKYEKEYTHILVFSQKNSGAPTARNRAFVESLGEFVVFLDSDDLLHPNNIELQIKTLITLDKSIVSFGEMSSFQKDISACTFKKLPSQRNYDNPIDYILDEKNHGFNTTVPFLWMIPRNIVEVSGGWNESLIINQDTEFIYKIILNSEGLRFTPNALGYYRLDNTESISRKMSHKKAIALVHSISLLEKTILKYERTHRVYKHFAKSYKYMMYRLYPDHVEAVDLAYKHYKRIGIKFVYIGGKKFKYLNKLMPTMLALYLSKL